MYFDIGSNVGKWTLANLNSTDKIISIEGSPSTFEKLKDNLKNNNKVVLLNLVVCNNNCKDIRFFDANLDTLSTINKNWLTSEKSRFFNETSYKEILCKTITIQKLIEKYGVPDLIKIDVEGGEYECILSLSQKVNLLCFEWAAETNEITLNCLDYLHTLGFEQFFIQNCDNYTFRPNPEHYYDINTTKNNLSKTVPKKDWGMIWCK